ncbi:MAG: hypothetical protein PVF27_03960 [Gemmatimonadales bacterium]|jgi:deoxyribodipyrimidine photo-lyase
MTRLRHARFAPAERVRTLHGSNPNGDNEFVLYWMTAARRLGWNWALDHAVAWARELGKPLLVFEPLRVDYPWASDRLHAFVLDGMADNAARCRAAGVAHYPYVEREAGGGKGLLRALARRAALVVTDDQPGFFLPRMLERAREEVPTRFEAVDGNGMLPVRATGKVFTTAHQFRRHLHGALPHHHPHAPSPDPLVALAALPPARLPEAVIDRWPVADPGEVRTGLGMLPIDHCVPAVERAGGARAAAAALERFLDERLAGYGEGRNDPGEELTSGLSPYLHFGHIGAQQVVEAVLEREQWSPDDVDPSARGKRSGWWGVSESAEAFLDELVTWRELGFNMAALRPDDYDRFAALPEWARNTLAAHAGDPREYVYTLDAFETAATHDELWNAAQRQLVREGRIHNYLRMLWGKKILEWTPTPEEALDVMLVLNDKYAVDGRDPNSVSGIFWVLGRYDRAWGPEREIFGTVRYMSSANTRRKFKGVRRYVERYAGNREP